MVSNIELNKVSDEGLKQMSADVAGQISQKASGGFGERLTIGLVNGGVLAASFAAASWLGKKWNKDWLRFSSEAIAMAGAATGMAYYFGARDVQKTARTGKVALEAESILRSRAEEKVQQLEAQLGEQKDVLAEEAPEQKHETKVDHVKHAGKVKAEQKQEAAPGL